MIIRDSLFERNGSCERACAHGLYVGQLDLLRIDVGAGRIAADDGRHAHALIGRLEQGETDQGQKQADDEAVDHERAGAAPKTASKAASAHAELGFLIASAKAYTALSS